MTLEKARKRVVSTVWGVDDPGRWQRPDPTGGLIGEIWFERPTSTAPPPSLLLKLLFAGEPLSIQVHPDDVAARELGLPHGKSEAWYVLSAAPGAEVALGLVRSRTAAELGAAIADGTIIDEVARKHVRAGDTIVVPGGTIHAIGAGVVVAEIQQRSDVTFRLFDYGRGRQLHVESAVAVSMAGPATQGMPQKAISSERRILTATDHFVLERIDLEVNSKWRTYASHELWMLVIDGVVESEGIVAAIGEALFANDQYVELRSGPACAAILVAYVPDSSMASCFTEHPHRGADATRHNPIAKPAEFRSANGEVRGPQA